MDWNVNSKTGDNGSVIHHIEKKSFTMEKVCAMLCFGVGLVFLVMAILGAWRYFFLMGLCLAVGIMIYDDSPVENTGNKKRREDR